MIKNKKFLAKGKRSVVFEGTLNGKHVVLKKGTKEDTPFALKNEAETLKFLNTKGLGPKLHESGDNWIIIDYVEGQRIVDWLKENDINTVRKVLQTIMRKCRKLDKLKIDKKEMHHPVKHIIIGKQVKFIDFERSKKTETPKNVTQFGQFLISDKISKLLSKKGFLIDKPKFISLLKEYKDSFAEKDFKKIVEMI